MATALRTEIIAAYATGFPLARAPFVSVSTEADVTVAASAANASPLRVMVPVLRADSHAMTASPPETQTTPRVPVALGCSLKRGIAANVSTTGISPRINGYATAKSPSRYADPSSSSAAIEIVTVSAIQGHAAAAGNPDRSMSAA